MSGDEPRRGALARPVRRWGGPRPGDHTRQTASSAPLAVDWLQLVLAGIVTLGLTTTVAVVIRKPLLGVLQLICGQEVAAEFWTTFSMVLIVMGPLFLVFTAAAGAESLADVVRRTVYLVSFGVIGAFLVMGAAVMLSIPSQTLTRRRAALIDVDVRRAQSAE